MKISAAESTALKQIVHCNNGHEIEVWYIQTPDGVVMELHDEPHQFLPSSSEDPAYAEGSCCFRAACEAAWTSSGVLHAYLNRLPGSK
jgi:hypothetical protein